MVYFFYKTTNVANGKVYYGVHKTEIETDSYLGSGSAIKSAIRKYGKTNFVREILKKFETESEMYYHEKDFINESIVNDPNTYNQTIGGRGGFSHIDLSGDKNPMKNSEVVDKLVKIRKNNGSYHSEKAKNAQLNSLKIATKKNIGKKKPEHSKFMSEWSKKNWEKNKESNRDALSSTFDLTSPDGIKYRTNRLQDFCEVNHLPYTSIWGISVTGKSPKKGRAKGWICMKVE